MFGGIAALLAVLGTLALVAWHCYRSDGPEPESQRSDQPSDPRRDYAGPFRNVRPEVEYVGDAACADCHQNIASSYRQSAMGRSLRPIAEVAPLQRYDASTNNPFTVLGYQFRVDRQGDHVEHRQTRVSADGKVLLDFHLDVDYVIGSGTRGYSYLTDRDGFLFQTPISWFAQKGIWDKSPGFEASRFAGRPITEACLFCHANRAVAVEDSDNRYGRPFAMGHAVGCERCHGPGALHVAEGGVMTAGFDATIVNPRRLTQPLREAVCQQCHLEGKARVLRRARRLDEFRPGLPLPSVLVVFEYADAAGDKAVSHVEQMALSACYRGSTGPRQMDCTTCHDPHRQVTAPERVAFYRQRCLQCHTDHACSATPAARAARHDSCSDCHMPRFPSGDIVHTASTDHRIIRPGRAAVPAPALGGRLVPFLGSDPAVPDEESARDLGIALVESAGRDADALERGLALLDKACGHFPTDVAALQARGDALLRLGRAQRAADALRLVLDLRPRRESALIGYALACEAVGDERGALDAWRRAVEVNPFLPLGREHLVSLLVKQRSWGQMRPHADAWLRLDPGNLEAHKAWILARIRNGEHAEARAAFARAVALHPFSRAALQAWFDDVQP